MPWYLVTRTWTVEARDIENAFILTRHERHDVEQAEEIGDQSVD